MNLTRLKTTILLVLFCATAASAARRVIHPKEFPAGRPFSPGLLVDGTLYVSGQVGQDLKTGAIPPEFEAEMRQCLDNIGLILKEGGMGFEDVISVQVYLTDIGLFQRMNAVYTTYFKEPRPTRTTVGVAGLAGPAKVEITVTARKAAPAPKGGGKK
jgi:reactive intermediate/imine deaminase